MVDLQEVKNLLTTNIEQVVAHLLPSGKRVRNEWQVGSINGEEGKSLSINLNGKAGVWSDFSTGESGDIISLWQTVRGCDFVTALSEAGAFFGLVDLQENISTPKETNKERKERLQQVEKIKQQRQDEEDKKHTAVKAEAVEIWQAAEDAPQNHPYIERKKIKAVTIRQTKRHGDLCLVVPVYIKGELTSLQFIKPDGEKRFLFGGEAKGGVCILGQVERRLYIAEGYATAATIHEATGEAVAVVFNTGNMMQACRNLAQEHKGINLVICADNDHTKKVNGGLKAGREVSEKLTYRIVYPQAIEGSDFNDMANECGLDAVRNALKVKDDSKPWMGNGNPWLYKCNASGVSKENKEDGDEERITHAPCWVSALSCDSMKQDAGNFGRLVHWIDQNGYERHRAIPARYFFGQSCDLINMLADKGLSLIYGKENKLVAYLSEFKPKARLISSPTTGWHGESFVLPHETINPPKGAEVVYQPTNSEALGGSIRAQGTLEQWKENVAMANASPLVRFAIVAALAAPMRFHADVDSGGFHFFGTTSRGKTTMMQAASSVWGNGVDPSWSGGGDVYLRRWNATKNGLEAMASSFNDLPFCIDEIGENDSKDFGSLIYNLMSGTGKARMDKGLDCRAMKSWRLLVLSAGELSVTGYIEEKGGTVRGGQLVRLVDIPISELFASEEEANNTKRACRDYFGTAGATFLARDSIVERFKLAWKDFDFEQVGTTNTPQAGRAMRRFCMVACVGELAIEAGILPWEQGSAINATKHAFEQWQGSSSAKTEGERGVDKIRAYILKHDSRFEREKAKVNPIPHERAGFYKEGHYHFLPESFDVACGGENSKVVKKELQARGWLKTASQKNLSNRVRFLELGKRIYVVSVADDIQEG